MIARFAAFGCVHAPFFDVGHRDWMLGQLRGRELTHVFCLGDLFEADAASVHPSEKDLDILEEYKAGAEYLSLVRAEVGDNCRLIWLRGNHDDNLQVKDPRRIPKSLRNAIHWNNSEWGPEFKRWHQFPYEKSRSGCYELGQVIFYHGFDVAQNTDCTEGIQMANLCGGHAHRLTVRAHTHQPQPVTQMALTKKVPLPYWYANVGTMGPLKPAYMARKDSSRWGAGLLVGEALIARPSRMRDGCNWEAELLTP